MELKPGYKQTEVGVIPEDWDVTTVGKAFEICNNLRLPISETIREKIVGPYPYYGPTCVQGYINEYRVEGEYALIGEDGDHFLKWKDQAMTLLVDGRFNVNNHAHLVRGTKNLTAWFYYYFSHRDLTPYLTRQGAGRYKLTKKTLVNILCALPPTKTEQDAIAEALSDADAFIDSLEQLIDKKRQIKQGMMQELLTGKKRLPGFSGVWEIKRLGDVVKITKGQLITEENAISGDIPVIAGGKKPAYFHNKPNRTGKTITISASGASAGYVALFNGSIFASDCSTISEGNDYSIEFIYTQLLLKQDVIFNAQTGGAQPHVHAVDLMLIEIGVPSLSEQIAIASILSDMGAEIDELELKFEKARKIKLAMMHDLLTGQIRLV
ncbi:restriction endonuclease subunit S [Chlorobium sp. KB01]|uniref:restriction endonuclease subunit S n=1 Tax=Chlorobium sp. KB01 TaxID=1917528 RepID=UPI00097541C9|nr:restriction endonuclease subunit S [Chlorobium sp. KB01]